MTQEIWKDVPCFAGMYQASNMGRVRSVDRLVNHCHGGKRRMRGKMLKPTPTPKGYHLVSLWRGGKEHKRYVHQIVAETFHGPCPDEHEVNHADLDKGNNRPANLEYVTREDNVSHATENGAIPSGEGHCMAKLSDDDVRMILRKYRDGALQSELAEEFGVRQNHISRLVNGKRRKDVTLQTGMRV